MCGITGLLYFKEKMFSTESLLPLVASLQARGPDESAFWEDEDFFLGHSRLSIIDLSTGQQPMALEDGSIAVTFNGEIYNYIELRKILSAEGHHFRTGSDTEVLLHGYREWGTALPEKLIGMFAFAIADRRKKTLFLARDRFGEKPLYLLEKDQFVFFASELRTACLLPGLEKEISRTSLLNYLSLNYVSGDQSMIEGIRKLKPGYWKIIQKDGSGSEECYYDISKEAKNISGLTFQEAKEETLRRIDESVRISLRSDVGAGIFLSGGIDSTLIASRAVQFGRLERAFSVSFLEKSHNEYDTAEKAALKLGIPIEKVEVSSQSMKSFLELAVGSDDPLGDSSCLPVFELSRQTSRKNKLVIGGDGGDELFGGYLTYKATGLHQKYISVLPVFLRRFLSKLSAHIPQNDKKVSFNYKLMRFLRAAGLDSLQAHFSWNGSWLFDDAAALINRDFFRQKDSNPYENMFRKYSADMDCSLRSLQILDLKEYLQNDILIKVDRMSMYSGLEVRAPFLHPSVAEFGIGLPADYKISKSGNTKNILRSISEDIFGRQISHAPKQGFSIPVHRWLRNESRELMLEILSEDYLRDLHFLNISAVRQKMQEHLAGKKAYGFELWGLMVLAVWYKAVIGKISLHRGDISRIKRRAF